MAANRPLPERATAAGPPDVGPLPSWNLADLYPDPNAPAIADDLARAGQEAHRLKARYEGKLAALGGEAIAEAIASY